MVTDRPHTAWIAVGSNMGDSLENCRRGIAEIERSGASELTARSRFYRTEPVDYIDQDWFVNAVVRIRTALSPRELLAELNAIEAAAGRDRSGVRFGPRPLDLDIVFFDDLVMNTPGLTLPHPRMHKRRFVLQPLCDIDPAIVHPVLQQSVNDLLDRLEETGQKVISQQ